MNRVDHMKYIGSMQQLAYVRPIEHKQGRASSLKSYQFQNGILSFEAMIDKCLDIANLTYKGANISFLAKQGLIGRMDFDTVGEEGTRNLMGGFLFTCGLENTCLKCSDDKAEYPMHGRIRSTPAEGIGSRSFWDTDNFNLEASGEMREAELFGKNLVLRRHISTSYNSTRLVINDTISNESFRDEPMMILYHFNLGYPFMDENAEILLPSKKCDPRDESAMKNKDLWYQMEAPQIDEPERVYLHELASDTEGETFAAAYNHTLGFGIKINFNKKYLPKFVQWKSIQSGDYVMGLEPTNSGVYGRCAEKDIHIIPAHSSENIRLVIEFFEGPTEYHRIKQQTKQLIGLTI